MDKKWNDRKCCIKNLIENISSLQKRNVEIGDVVNDKFMASQNNNALQLFKYALYYAWEVFGYGYHGDFDDEENGKMGYMMFELDAINLIVELMETLKRSSPLSDVDNGEAMTDALGTILQDVAQNMKNNEDIDKLEQ